MNEYWQELIQIVKHRSKGNLLEVVRLVHGALHEISVCGDLDYAQEIATAWMEVLSDFLPKEGRQDGGDTD